MSRHVMLCHVMHVMYLVSRHATPCHVKAYHVMSRHVTLRHVTSCYVISLRKSRDGHTTNASLSTDFFHTQPIQIKHDRVRWLSQRLPIPYRISGIWSSFKNVLTPLLASICLKDMLLWHYVKHVWYALYIIYKIWNDVVIDCCILGRFCFAFIHLYIIHLYIYVYNL